MQCLLHLNKHFTLFSLSLHHEQGAGSMSTLFSSFIACLAGIFCPFPAAAHRKMWDGLYISGDCIPWLSVMYIEWVHRAKLALSVRSVGGTNMSVFTMSLSWYRHYVSLLIQTLVTMPHFLTRDNNPTLEGWRPGHWITLMIQMSSFLI